MKKLLAIIFVLILATGIAKADSDKEYIDYLKSVIADKDRQLQEIEQAINEALIELEADI